MTIGERIKKIRKERGFTQKHIADLCGMADSAIRKYESDKVTPTLRTASKLADALGVPVQVLFGADHFKEMLSADDYDCLIDVYNRLNPLGQQKALELVEMLAGNPQYQRDNSAPASEDQG